MMKSPAPRESFPEIPVQREVSRKMGEPEVVPCFQLSQVLKAWVVRWFADRPMGGGTVGYEAEALDKSYFFMGPIEWLSEQSEIHVRQVSRIVNGEIITVSMKQAERWLMAIDREYMLDTGENQAVPNPNWSQEEGAGGKQKKAG